MAVQDPLAKALNYLLNEMEKKGMVRDLKDKQQLIETVVNVIKATIGNPSLEQLKDRKFQKILSVCLMAEGLKQHKPEYNLDYKKLLDPLLKLKPEALKKELKTLFEKLLQDINKLTPEGKRLKPKELEAFANKLANEACREDKHALENDNLVNTMGEVFTEALRNLFGGTDPRVTGGHLMPVLQIAGNLFGIADQQGGNVLSNAFIDETNRFDAGKADYTGAENSVKINSQLTGFINDVGNGMEIAISTAPRPHLPGTVT